MVSSARAARIGQRIKEEFSELLLFGVSDPRLNEVYVTYVRVDRELAFANIFVSALEGKVREQEILQGLQHASGFLRHQLATRIDLRSFPELRFHWDPIPENADRIDQILDSLKTDDDNQD